MKHMTVKSASVRVILCLICFCLMLPVFSSCSKPPEYSEIEERFRELVEASYEINDIFFGKGLPTYERVTDPKENTSLYVKAETEERYYYYELEDEVYGKIVAYKLDLSNSVYVDEKSGKKYFYYQIYDQDYGKIMVAKSSDGKEEYYLQLLDAPKDGVDADYVNESKGIYGYSMPEDFQYNKENQSYSYAMVTKEPHPEMDGLIYAEEKVYCYALKDYKEPIFESYYDENDPVDYDYVTADSSYYSINQIKQAAEKVYSKEYLASIYDAQFVGTVAADASVSGLFARYMEYTDDLGSMALMKSNTYEPLIRETRLYLFDTAKIVKPSNKNFVTVSIDSYLPSKPSDILNVTVTMILQDGVWVLDCATY